MYKIGNATFYRFQHTISLTWRIFLIMILLSMHMLLEIRWIEMNGINKTKLLKAAGLKIKLGKVKFWHPSKNYIEYIKIVQFIDYKFTWFTNYRERKGEQADAIKDDANAELRNRKKSVRIKSNKDKNDSRQNSVRSHQTPSPYMVSININSNKNSWIR